MTRSLVLAVVAFVVLALSPVLASAGIALTPSTRWSLNGGLDPNFVGSMSGVGDLNGDGYGDVAWGLGGTVGVGQVYVLYGSSTGVHAGPSWDWGWDESTAYFTARSEVGASIS